MNQCERCGPYSSGHTRDDLYTAYDSAVQEYVGGDSPHTAESEMRKKWVDCWQDLRIAIEGQKAVRENAMERCWIETPEAIQYRLDEGGYSEKNSAKREYEYYINRAQYPEIVRFARDITIGRVMRHEPTIEGIEQDGVTGVFALTQGCIDNADDTGRNFEQLAHFMLAEKFTTGRSAIYAYNSASSGPAVAKLKIYTAENVWTWATEGELDIVVFRERETVKDGKYSQNTDWIYRELCIEDGVVVERIWRKNESGKYKTAGEQILRIREQALTRIPVVFDGGRRPTNPPYQALFNKSIEAFQISAQLKHRLFRVHNSWLHLNHTNGGGIVDGEEPEVGEIEKPQGEPMPLVPGLGVLITEDTAAQYLIDSGAGVQHLRDERTNCMAEMASLGARFGINFGASNISTDTERMQQGGETAFIISHINDTSEALTQAFRWKAEIENKPEQAVREISIKLNTELTDEGLPFTLADVCKAYESGLISGEIAFEHVRMILPSIAAEETWESVYARIIAEQSGVFDVPDDTQNEDEDFDGEDE